MASLSESDSSLSHPRHQLLDDNNFSVWKRRMEGSLQLRKLWKYACGTSKAPPLGVALKSDANAVAAEQKAYNDWHETDQQAAAYIISFISDSQLHHVPQGASAHEVWTLICAAHEKTGMHSELHYIRLIVNSRYADGEKMQPHINSMRDNNNRLLAMGSSLYSRQLACFLMNSLPPSYSPLLMTLTALKREDVTFDYVSTTLLSEERRRHNETQTDGTSASALYHTGRPTPAPSPPQPSLPPVAPITAKTVRKKCTHCKKSGHSEAKCYQKHGYPAGHPSAAGGKEAHLSAVDDDDNIYLVLALKEDEEKETTASATAAHLVAPLASSPSTPPSSLASPSVTLHSSGVKTATELDWLIDSGASMHYCRHREWFDSFEPTSGRFVTLGDSRRLAVTGRGTLRVDVPVPGPGSALLVRRSPTCSTYPTSRSTCCQCQA